MTTKHRIFDEFPMVDTLYRNSPYEYQFTGEIGQFANIVIRHQSRRLGRISQIGSLQDLNAGDKQLDSEIIFPIAFTQSEKDDLCD